MRSVPVAVVEIGQVPMLVGDRLMTMDVRMRPLDGSFVRVAVVLVVDVHVLVLDRLVGVALRVLVADQEHDAGGRQKRGAALADAEPIPQERHRHRRPHEGRGRKEGGSRATPSTRSAYMSRRMLTP